MAMSFSMDDLHEASERAFHQTALTLTESDCWPNLVITPRLVEKCFYGEPVNLPDAAIDFIIDTLIRIESEIVGELMK